MYTSHLWMSATGGSEVRDGQRARHSKVAPPGEAQGLNGRWLEECQLWWSNQWNTDIMSVRIKGGDSYFIVNRLPGNYTHIITYSTNEELFSKTPQAPFQKLCLQCLYQACRLRFRKQLFTYVYIYIYTYSWRDLFLNTISELGIGIASPSFGMALITFWKRALYKYIYTNIHMYICANIHIYTYTHIHIYT